MVQDISRGRGDCATRDGYMYAHFVYMGYLVKTQVGNGLSKIFYFRDQTIYVSDQAVYLKGFRSSW